MNMDLFDSNFDVATDNVRLRCIRPSDIESFRAIMFESETWEFFTDKYVEEGDLQDYVEQALADFRNRTRIPLAIIDRTTNAIVGSSSFGNISQRDKRLEIGWTWLCKTGRGSGVNRNCKFLMLEHAFETLGFYRVEFKTDVLNQAARKALTKIGAVEEGVLRSHTQMHSDRRRDTIYYSILADEWPTVRLESFDGIARC